MEVRRRWRDGLDCKSSALAEQVRILPLPPNAGLERILATQRDRKSRPRDIVS